MNIKNILNVVLIFVLGLGMAGCSDSDPIQWAYMHITCHGLKLIRPISMQESGAGTGQ